MRKSRVCLREKQNKVQNQIPAAEVGTRTLNDIFGSIFCALPPPLLTFLIGQKTAFPRKNTGKQGGNSYFLKTEPTTVSLFPEWLETSSSC